MGIELYSQILSLNNARRCRLSTSQLVPSGAKLMKVGSTNSCGGTCRARAKVGMGFFLLISLAGWGERFPIPLPIAQP